MFKFRKKFIEVEKLFKCPENCEKKDTEGPTLGEHVI